MEKEQKNQKRKPVSMFYSEEKEGKTHLKKKKKGGKKRSFIHTHTKPCELFRRKKKVKEDEGREQKPDKE